MHPFRIEFDDELDAVCRHKLVVVGPIDPRRRVRFRAAFFELSIEAPRGKLLGFAEHQVLEQVREPCFARMLVARTYVEPGVVSDDRGRVIREHEHGEAVAEPPSGERFPPKQVLGLEHQTRAVARCAGVYLLRPRAALRTRVLASGKPRHRAAFSTEPPPSLAETGSTTSSAAPRSRRGGSPLGPRPSPCRRSERRALFL